MFFGRLHQTSAILALVVAVALACAPSQAQKSGTAQITVFAAASLKTALDEAADAFTAATGRKVVVSYAASSALAKQIEQAAPADIFISADLDWMDYLASKGLILDGTRETFLGNELVLIAPASSRVTLEIKEGFPLAAALEGGRLVTGDVKSVPAGKYAKAALEALKVWADVEPKLAPADNVRAALALVAQGEAPLGIVYRTDAAADPKVKIIGTFPPSAHPPIVYPLAVMKGSTSPEEAKALIAFLTSPKGQAAFTKQGFTLLK